MHPTTEVTVITDPLADDESRSFVQSLRGCVALHGSPIVDGTPTGSRTLFRLDHADLVSGGLAARVEALLERGIAVHRVVGDHPAVRDANARLGWMT